MAEKLAPITCGFVRRFTIFLRRARWCSSFWVPLMFFGDLPSQAPGSCCSEAQLTALRFASDRELPELIEKALAAEMPAPEIKKNIAARRADRFRV